MKDYKHQKMLVEHLSAFVKTATKNVRFGYNVTLPYKRVIMPLLDDLSTEAKTIGAVNTVIFRNGEQVGCNTDWYGLYQSIKTFYKDYQSIDKITILGTGGASRAAIYAAKKLAAKVVVVYRANPLSTNSQEMMEESSELGIEMVPYDASVPAIRTSQCIIQTTSAGMIGTNTQFPFDDAVLADLLKDIGSCNCYVDAVFNPVETPTLKLFKNRAMTIDGLWMMIFQAIQALSFWSNKNLNFSTNALIRVHRQLMADISASNEPKYQA